MKHLGKIALFALSLIFCLTTSHAGIRGGVGLTTLNGMLEPFETFITQCDTVTETLFVDGNRVDAYTEVGSIMKPYKTIQAAIAMASGDVIINVAPGTYDGDVDLGVNVVSIRGSGINATHFTGNITAGARAHTLEEFRIKTTGSLTITDNIFATNLHIQGPVTVSGEGFLEGNLLYIAPDSGVVPLTVNSTGGTVLIRSSIIAQGNVHAIDHTSGTVILFHSYAKNSSFTTITIDSSGGACGLIDTDIYNVGFGSAVNLDNDGSALTANTLSGITCSGNISCGSAETYVEGLNFVGFGSLSGSNLIYRPASRLSYDNSISGLIATKVKTAIDELTGMSTVDAYWTRDDGNGYLYPSNLANNVGIGTAEPSSLFTVAGTIGAIKIEASTLTDGLATMSAGALTGITTLSMNNQLTNTLADGTAPLVITSTTKVANLNVDQVDGKDSTDLVLADGSQALTANWDAGSHRITAEGFESDVTTGTAPIVVASTTKVTNFNADQVDSISATTSATANQLLALDADKDLELGTGDVNCADVTATNFYGDGSSLTGIGILAGNNTWTGLNTFEGGAWITGSLTVSATVKALGFTDGIATMSAGSITATTVTATTLYGDGSNITNVGAAAASALTLAVKEENTSAISKGQVVYVSGSAGVAQTKVGLANPADSNKTHTIGIAAGDITKNGTGLVRIRGELLNVDTRTSNSDVNPNAETWAAGDALYLTGDGGMTNVEPSTGGSITEVGHSLLGSNLNDSILVNAKYQPTFIACATGESIELRMGDSAGATSVDFEDYTGATVASLDSNGNFNAITFILTGDIYTVDWTNYGATSTIVGFSGTPTKNIWYKKVGDIVSVRGSIEGVSSRTDFTFTLPYTSANRTGGKVSVACPVRHEGVFLDSLGCLTLSPNSAIVTMHRTGDTTVNNWVNDSNLKGAFFSFQYEAQ